MVFHCRLNKGGEIERFSLREKIVIDLLHKTVWLLGFGNGRRFSYFRMLVWWSKSRLAVAQTQKTSRAIFQDFYPGRSAFTSCFWNGSTENVAIMFFGCVIKSEALKILDLWLSCLDSEKSHVDPATQIHPILQTMFLGPNTVSLAQNWTGQNANANWVLRFRVKYPKNVVSKLLVEPFRNSEPQRPFSGMKILEERTWLFFEFWRQPKVSSTITTHTKI